MDVEDRELIERIQCGDKTALTALIQHHYRPVRAFLYRRSGDYALAEDLTQETFLKMTDALIQYKERGMFKAWLFRIAANLCANALRARKPTVPFEPDMGKHIVPDTQFENAQALKTAFFQLPDAQSEAIILRYYHEFSLQEIAKIQRMPLSTVKSRLRRGLAQMKLLLGEAYEFEAKDSHSV